MTVLVMTASPRRDGNSTLMAQACAYGIRESGTTATLLSLPEAVTGFLRDCRICRQPDGDCGIADGYAKLLQEELIPAEAIVYATPLYWYGMAASLKNFFDRLFCYTAASYPDSERVVDALAGKRIALLISSEETFPAATNAVVSQVHEASRYLRQHFVGVERGIGNRRGDVELDPDDPLGRARRLGSELLTRHHSDYTAASTRPGSVWAAPKQHNSPSQDT
ncbi:flavodoxin family protein [Sciscionella marina]|uniref:flavodoxin family protein n=1 Tax=Sciscionella marina TaxID=508770 RepID=UPI000477C202|nr:flavodoxin family protein [Sciscionella marina]